MYIEMFECTQNKDALSVLALNSGICSIFKQTFRSHTNFSTFNSISTVFRFIAQKLSHTKREREKGRERPGKIWLTNIKKIAPNHYVCSTVLLDLGAFRTHQMYFQETSKHHSVVGCLFFCLFPFSLIELKCMSVLNWNRNIASNF